MISEMLPRRLNATSAVRMKKSENDPGKSLQEEEISLDGPVPDDAISAIGPERFTLETPKPLDHEKVLAKFTECCRAHEATVEFPDGIHKPKQGQPFRALVYVRPPEGSSFMGTLRIEGKSVSFESFQS